MFGLVNICSALPSEIGSITKYSFDTPSGESRSLSEFSGSTVLLHFFASWCGECLLEIPSLNSLFTSLIPSNVVVVGVAINDDALAVKAMVDRFQIPFPVVIDRGDILKRYFEIRGVPSNFVINSTGKIVDFLDPKSGKLASKIQGPRDWSSQAVLSGLLAISNPRST